jgi:hypothetical protein
VAAFVRIGWSLSIGIDGRLPSESVAALPRIPQAADPFFDSNDPKDRKKIERAIKLATDSYYKVKSMDPEAWGANWDQK